MYRNAGVMLEMVYYAARNGDSIDRILLETLRSDAMQIRIGVLTVLAHCVFNQASESVRSNAFQVIEIQPSLRNWLMVSGVTVWRVLQTMESISSCVRQEWKANLRTQRGARADLAS